MSIKFEQAAHFSPSADGRLEHSLTYRSVTATAAAAVTTTTTVANTALAKQDCYVNTVIFCEVPRDACYRPSAPATTIITGNRCCLQSELKHGCPPAHSLHCDRLVTSRAQAGRPARLRTGHVTTALPGKPSAVVRAPQRLPSGQEVNLVTPKKWPLIASAKNEKSAKRSLNKIALPPCSGTQILPYTIFDSYFFFIQSCQP